MRSWSTVIKGLVQFNGSGDSSMHHLENSKNNDAASTAVAWSWYLWFWLHTSRLYKSWSFNTVLIASSLDRLNPLYGSNGLVSTNDFPHFGQVAMPGRRKGAGSWAVHAALGSRHPWHGWWEQLTTSSRSFTWWWFVQKLSDSTYLLQYFEWFWSIA